LGDILNFELTDLVISFLSSFDFSNFSFSNLLKIIFILTFVQTNGVADKMKLAFIFSMWGRGRHHNPIPTETGITKQSAIHVHNTKF
jgi:hypothetical protein